VKILLTYEYPFHKQGYGGGQQIVRDFSYALASKGYDVVVSCLGNDEFNLKSNKLNVNFEFNFKYKKGFSSFILSTISSILLINKYKPDIVLSFTSEAALINIYCKIKKIPFFIYVAAPKIPIFRLNKPIESLYNIRYHFPLFMQYFGTMFSKMNFTISEFIGEELANNWNISKKNIYSIGCGVSEIVLNHISDISNLDTNMNFVTTGRIMFSHKPINLVANSISKFNFNQWHIIGSGEDLNNLKIILKDLKIYEKTVIHSTLSSNEICNLYDDARIIILPSNHESFFITAYEAIALNKVLVTNKVANLEKIFSKFPTVIFAEDVSINSYESAINKAIEISNKNIKSKLNDASKFVKDNFSWNNVVNKFENYIK
jgi:glycosyltransferase involved in cell wall biosynthesis